jgi:protoheme IX farnesyltransferase
VSNAQPNITKLNDLKRSHQNDLDTRTTLKRPMATDLLNPTTTRPSEGLVPVNSVPEVGSEQKTDSDATVIAKSTPSVFQDYVQLTKPRIVVMILVTTIATAIIGAGSAVSAIDMSWLLIGTAAIAASAGAANQIWERSIDRRMTRTANRPLPSGRQQTVPAVLFTAALGIVGTVILASRFGPTPAWAGVATWLLYVLVYTPMKTRTAWNTTVGAIAGALPVLIGYTATGGAITDWTPWLLVGVLVAWQYPHFMSIAWMYRRQYAEAGFCMTTTIEPTGRSAGWQSIAGSVALILCGVALCLIPSGAIGAVIGSIAVVAASLPMLSASIRFAKDPNDLLARKLLRSSLLVLPAVLTVVTIRVFW